MSTNLGVSLHPHRLPGHTTRSIVETLSHTHGLAKAAVEYRAYWK